MLRKNTMGSRAGTTRLPSTIACDQRDATGFLVRVDDLAEDGKGGWMMVRNSVEQIDDILYLRASGSALRHLGLG